MNLVKQVLQRQTQERESLMRESLKKISEAPDNWSPRYVHGHSTKHIPEHDGATEAPEDTKAEDAAWRQTPWFRPEGL